MLNMKIYWNMNSIPEFEGVSNKLRKTVWSMASRKLIKQWQAYVVLFSTVVAFGLLVGVLPESLGYVGGGLGGGVGTFLMMQLVGRNCADCLKELQSKIDDSHSSFPTS